LVFTFFKAHGIYLLEQFIFSSYFIQTFSIYKEKGFKMTSSIILFDFSFEYFEKNLKKYSFKNSNFYLLLCHFHFYVKIYLSLKNSLNS